MSLISPSLHLPAPLALGVPAFQTHILSLLLTSSYVGSLYLSQTLFPSPRLPQPSTREPSGVAVCRSETTPKAAARDPNEPIMASDSDAPLPGSRDHPDTIRLRIKAVGLATVGSVGAVLAMVWSVGGYGFVEAIRPTLRLLGIPTALSAPSLLPYLLAPALLLGPLYATFLDRALPFQTHAPSLRQALHDLDLVAARNYLVGPVTEELVFRSTVLAAALLGRLPPRTLVFGTPLWFGLAHAHHALEVYAKAGGGRGPALSALGGSLFQFSYTTLFGWFAAYLFLRTGSVLPPIVSHMYCNYMGIYLPSRAARRHPRRRSLVWGTYILGVVGFVVGLRAL